MDTAKTLHVNSTVGPDATAKREFCTNTFRLTIRESRAHDVYAIIDDVTTPEDPPYVIVSVIIGFRNLSII